MKRSSLASNPYMRIGHNRLKRIVIGYSADRLVFRPLSKYSRKLRNRHR